MSALNILLLTVAVCVLLRVEAQLEPQRRAPTVLRDQCLSEDVVAEYAADNTDTLARIAQGIVNGTRGVGCLNSIYMLAYTGSSSRNAGSNHPHDFEVKGAGQTRYITLPERPGDYERHQGDIWKLDIIEDLGFLPGTCLRLCGVESMRLAEGGNDGWLVDSVVTFGCINDVGCSLLTMDMDVLRWIDGNGAPDRREFPLTLATQSSCV
jgi:hypothetical protein